MELNSLPQTMWVTFPTRNKATKPLAMATLSRQQTIPITSMPLLEITLGSSKTAGEGPVQLM